MSHSNYYELQNNSQQYYPLPQNPQNQNEPHNINNNQSIPILVYNQLNPVLLDKDPGTNSYIISCHSCGITSSTKVDLSLNFSNYCCYFLCGYLLYPLGLFVFLGFNFFKDKNLMCCDGYHYCNSCGALVGIYKAC